MVAYGLCRRTMFRSVEIPYSREDLKPCNCIAPIMKTAKVRFLSWNEFLAASEKFVSPFQSYCKVF
jgi:hypothetical protein